MDLRSDCFRWALLEAGVDQQLQAGSPAEGADSIVVSGGYEDDDSAT